MRDRAAALAAALTRQRRLDRLRRAGIVRLALPGGGAAPRSATASCAVLGRRARGPAPASASASASEHGPPAGAARPAEAVTIQPRLALGPGPPAPDCPLPPDLADEVGAIAGWLEAEAGRVRIEHCDGELASPAARLPTFTPAASLRCGMGDVLAAMLIATLLVMVVRLLPWAPGRLSRLRRRNQVSLRHRVTAAAALAGVAAARAPASTAASAMPSPRCGWSCPGRPRRRSRRPSWPTLGARGRRARGPRRRARPATSWSPLGCGARRASPLRARLAGQVGDVERVAARVTAAAARPRRRSARAAQPTPEALAELDEQLDALEAARDELARLEARVGLVTSP